MEKSFLRMYRTVGAGSVWRNVDLWGYFTVVVVSICGNISFWNK